jgi:hypothetical protein
VPLSAALFGDVVGDTEGMASSNDNALLHPIRSWRIWMVCFGGVAAMIYGSQPVAEAMGDQAFAYAYIGVVAVLM